MTSTEGPAMGPSTGPSRKLYRSRSGRVLAGVAAGVAEHLGVRVLWVRIVFAGLIGVAGAGVLGYALLWGMVPSRSGDEEEARPASARERTEAVALIVLGTALALVMSTFGGAQLGWVTGPLGVAAVGAALVWREADETRRQRWRRGAGALLGPGRSGLARVGAGVALVATGLAIFLFGQVDLGQVPFALLAVGVTLVGVVVLTVPWWIRLRREAEEERRARIRTQERAEIAAHLHDSVLQTLALIQRQSGEDREVRRLARSQERQLRAWLYGPEGLGPEGLGPEGLGAAGHDTGAGEPATAVGGSLSEALTLAAAAVEDGYAVEIEAVIVGDCRTDDALLGLVAAAREAMVNAAKHAGVGELSIYAEVTAELVEVFVRDRGCGFDPDLVPEDRHGLADSVRGRTDRHGGTVTLRTAPGAGTEVRLVMPRVRHIDIGSDEPTGERR